MALIEIKMKIYKPTYNSTYNYPHLSSTMFETQKEEYLKEQEQNEYESERDLEIWLEDRYSIAEIFNMSEDERHEIDNKWRKSCREYVEELFKDDYEEEEITLKVEEEDLNKYDNFRLIRN